MHLVFILFYSNNNNINNDYYCVQVLSHCERITDIGINHLVSNTCGDKLQILELDNCPLITDDSLDKLR